MELLEFALRVIRDECSSHRSGCDCCPLRGDENGYSCMLKNLPEEWELISDKESKKLDRLFK